MPALPLLFSTPKYCAAILRALSPHLQTAEQTEKVESLAGPTGRRKGSENGHNSTCLPRFKCRRGNRRDDAQGFSMREGHCGQSFHVFAENVHGPMLDLGGNV